MDLVVKQHLSRQRGGRDAMDALQHSRFGQCVFIHRQVLLPYEDVDVTGSQIKIRMRVHQRFDVAHMRQRIVGAARDPCDQRGGRE